MKDIERDVLGWISEHTDSAELSAQLAAAAESRRTTMSTGVLLYFDLPDGLDPVPDGVRPVAPHIHSEAMMDGAGCSLFLRNGRLHYLEIYTRGGFYPEDLESWELLAQAPD